MPTKIRNFCRQGGNRFRCVGYVKEPILRETRIFSQKLDVYFLVTNRKTYFWGFRVLQVQARIGWSYSVDENKRHPTDSERKGLISKPPRSFWIVNNCQMELITPGDEQSLGLTTKGLNLVRGFKKSILSMFYLSKKCERKGQF